MNFGMSRILVPVDFSSHAEAALRYAATLANRLGSSLELLHVVQPVMAGAGWNSEVSAAGRSSGAPDADEDARRRLEGMADGVAVPVTTTIRTGPPAHTIVAFAESSGADLIVMGTRGRGGLAQVFMGSVAERVLRHAPCPVLTVRDPDALGGTTPALTLDAALLRAALGRLGTSRE
jgi:nucleotide-binding universal stress UspA family protein